MCFGKFFLFLFFSRKMNENTLFLFLNGIFSVLCVCACVCVNIPVCFMFSDMEHVTVMPTEKRHRSVLTKKYKPKFVSTCVYLTVYSTF